MAKYKLGARVVFSVLLVPVCFIGAAWVSSMFISKNEGFVGAATVVMYALGGAIAGLIGGIIASGFLQQRTLVRANWVLLTAVVISVSWLTYRYQKAQANDGDNSTPAVPKPATAPAENVQMGRWSIN